MKKFSVIIANYNYGKYISNAIDSALSQSGVECEVIVVDDGSKDNSKTVIQGYGSKIISKFIENSGQRNANNVGFSCSSGDIIIFLDADDVLCPGALEKISHAWREGCSKVQGRMQRVDANLRPNGNIIPKLTKNISRLNILKWTERFCDYPSPPGSGNAYSRAFLEKIFPIEKNMDAFTDTTCIASAPYFGDIVTINEPLVLYRNHGENDSNMADNPANFSRELRRALKRLHAAQTAGKEQNFPIPDFQSLFRNTHLLQLRVAAQKLTPEDRPLSGDSPVRVAFDIVSLPFRQDYNTLKFRMLAACWSLATFISPPKIARLLIRKRFS